jgi:hypothetical protein
VEGDALDKASQDLPVRCFRLGRWQAAHELPSSATISNS